MSNSQLEIACRHISMHMHGDGCAFLRILRAIQVEGGQLLFQYTLFNSWTTFHASGELNCCHGCATSSSVYHSPLWNTLWLMVVWAYL